MPEPNVARTDAASYYKTSKPKPDAARTTSTSNPARSYASRKPSGVIDRKTPRRFRGVPPPLPFDIDALPDSTLLTSNETGAFARVSTSALDSWRRFPDHPLRWRLVGGRILYELGSLREFLKGVPGGRRPWAPNKRAINPRTKK
jgi:hypothetical protein